LSKPKQEEKSVMIKGRKRKVLMITVNSSHRKDLRTMFNAWKNFSSKTKSFGARGVNLHEAISESAFALAMKCPRILKVDGSSSSFDNYDPRTRKRIQVKATSVESDLTSFGPKSEYDELYWVDFYRDGKLDGKFDIYKIPNKLVSRVKVNRSQTMKSQQRQKRRPRFSIRKKIIIPYKIKPTKTSKI